MQVVTPQGDTVTISYEFVDQPRARELLDANELNRPLADSVWEGYARSMIDGDWVFTADPLQMAATRLLNGQHRARAIEECGIGQWVLVATGLPESVQQYMDIGRRRSAVDMLTLQGVEKPRVLAATAHLLICWEHWRTYHSQITPGVHEVTEYALEHQDAIREAWTVAAEIFRTVNGGISVPAVAAAYYRGMEITEPFIVAHFFDRIASNSGLKKGEPAHALISRFINLENSSRVRDLWLTVRAWNAEMRGDPLRLAIPKDGISSTQMPDMTGPQAEDVSIEKERALAALEKLEDDRHARKGSE